jgi:hypothetical protein
MKICILVLMAIVITGASRGQEPGNVFMLHPYITHGDLSKSRFWTQSRIALVSLDGAAKTADGFFNRKNIDGRGDEYNPLARPFVHTTAIQVAAMAALFGTEIATAYLLHRRRRDNLAQATLAGGAVMNGLGAGDSFRHRVAGW